MRFVQRQARRKVYVEQVDGSYFLSPLPEAVNNYRPVQQFSTREELDAFLATCSVEVVWQ